MLFRLSNPRGLFELKSTNQRESTNPRESSYVAMKTPAMGFVVAPSTTASWRCGDSNVPQKLNIGCSRLLYTTNHPYR